MAGAIVTPGSDLWESPRPLFDNMNRRFQFTVDAAANADNALLPRWWGPDGQYADALGVPWRPRFGGPERVYCNPPFSLVDEFIEKAHDECHGDGVLAVLLLKVQTGKKIWRSKIAYGAGNIGMISGRLSYGRPDGESVGATFDSCIVVFDPYWPPGIPAYTWLSDRIGNPVHAQEAGVWLAQ